MADEKKAESKAEGKKMENKTEEKKVEAKKEEKAGTEKTNADKKEDAKEETKAGTKAEQKAEKKVVKEKAIAKGNSMRTSMKHCKAICRMIMGNTIEGAIKMVEEVLDYSRVVPMNDMEIPHRKGRGIMAGRYPQNASAEMMKLLKQLRANATIANINNPKIVLAIANEGSRPYRREGRRSKRTNVYMEVRDSK